MKTKHKKTTVFMLARKLKAVKLKGCLCENCGLNLFDNYWCADFHHKNSNTKEYGISTLLLLKDWLIVETELQKCMLLCAHCHKKLHRQHPEELLKEAVGLLQNNDIEKLYQRKSTAVDKNTAKKLFSLGYSYEKIEEIIKFKEATIRGWCPKNLPSIDWNDENIIIKIKNMYESYVPLGVICTIIKCTFRTLIRNINLYIQTGKFKEREVKKHNQFTKDPKKVSVLGNIYENVSEASRKLKINYTTIKSRVLSKNKKFKNYFYLDTPK